LHDDVVANLLALINQNDQDSFFGGLSIFDKYICTISWAIADGHHIGGLESLALMTFMMIDKILLKQILQIYRCALSSIKCKIQSRKYKLYNK